MTAPEIRIGDAERHAAQDRLQAAYAEGALDLDELEDRLSRALTAKTPSDLQPLLADLPTSTVRPPRPDAVPTVSGPAQRSTLGRIGGGVVAAAAVILATLWISSADSVAIFSSTTYSVTDAAVQQHVDEADDGEPLEIRVLSLFGSVEVQISPLADVRAQTVAVMGSVNCDACGAAAPGGQALAAVEIGGASVFGSVEIVSQ